MPSSAFTGHLIALLADADHLDNAHGQLPAGPSGPSCTSSRHQQGRGGHVFISLGSLYRGTRPGVAGFASSSCPTSGTLACIECFRARTVGAVQYSQYRQCSDVDFRRHRAPKRSSFLELAELHPCPSSPTFGAMLDLRHEIAHGTNPRPVVTHFYSSQLADFFRRLGRCTDDAVRAHFVNVHGNANPWPL